MTTLVGREAWHVSSTLRHGRITEHGPLDPDQEITIMVVKFVDDCGHSDLLPADSMILHRDAAIDAAYEMADLWQRQARMLEQEA